MCTNLNLIDHPTILTKPTLMYLLDGSIKIVHHVGNVTLHPRIVLLETLHVPSFKFNLLSMHKLTKIAHIGLED